MAIEKLLQGKDAKKKANIKGVEIAKMVKKKKYKLKNGIWS